MSQTYVTDSFKLCSPLDFISNVEDELPRLLISVENNVSRSHLSLVLTFLFGKDSVLCHVSRNDLEHSFLNPALTSLSKVFSSKLSKTLSILENIVESHEDIHLQLIDYLQGSLDVLSGYNDILNYLENLSQLKSREIESLITTLPQVLLEAFSYCRGSETVYGSYFSLCTDLLTAFFRKSYEVSSAFYKILDEHIIFDCSSENDVALLVSALETLCSVGEIVVSLDVKSLVDQWKGICKLYTKYSNDLKDRLNISQPLKYLSYLLRKTICSITDEQDQENENTINRNLKLGSFILKIVVKLAELYCGYIGPCMSDLIELLLLLNRCSRLSRSKYCNELDRFIVIGAGPLLSNLIHDNQFFEEYKFYSDSIYSKPIEDIVGLFFTNIRLLKLLISNNDSSICEKWLGVPLVTSVIFLYEKCFQYLDLTVNIGDNNVYTTLISVTAAYVISNFTTDNFISLEKFLLEKVVKPNIDTAIFCVDILILLCRLTNEDVCYMNTRFIFHALTQTGPNFFRPEVILARVTAGRLFSLLTKTKQEAIQKEFSSYFHAWRHVKFTSNEMMTMVKPHLDINQVNNPADFFSLVESLHLICLYGYTSALSELEIVEIISQLLICHKIYSDNSKSLQDWWYNSFFVIAHSISLTSQWINSTRLSEMLDIFQELVFKNHPPTIYYIINALVKLLNAGLLLNESCQLDKVIQIFQLSLTSNNILLKQFVIENWLSINSFKTRNFLLFLDDETQKLITSFNKKKLFPQLSKHLYSLEIQFLHKCNNSEDSEEIPESHPPNKKIKHDIDSSVADVIILLKKSVENVEVYATQNNLSIEEKQILQILRDDLDNLVS